MKHVFVINPIAGKGNGLKLLPMIKEIFAARDEEYILEITKRPGHAKEIAKRHASKGNCRVYSVGGDGTLNEVLNGLVGTDCSLAIIPCGSGNDFIRTITKITNPEDLLLRTIDGHESVIDVAKVNGRYFINIASMGFDAEVVYNAGRFKKVPGISGSLAYILGIIVTAFEFGGRNFKISIDGHVVDRKLLLAAIANGKYYGGGMLPAPEAKVDDGLFDICMIDAIGKVKILTFFPKLIKGTHGDMKEVTFYRGKQIEIKTDREISLNIDGEVFRGCEAVFEIAPNAISIVMPKI